MKVMVFPKKCLDKEVIVQSNSMKRKSKMKIINMIVTGLIVLLIVFLTAVLPGLLDN